MKKFRFKFWAFRGTTIIEDESKRVHFLDENFAGYLKYIAYGYAGGFYFSSVFDPWLRTLCYVILILVGCIQFSSVVGYIMNRGNLENYADASATIMFVDTIQGTGLCLVIAQINQYFHKKLEMALFQNDALHEEMKSLQQRDDIKSISKSMVIFIICGNIAYFMIVAGGVVQALVNASQEELKESRFQFLPHPFTPFITNELSFIGITAVIYIPLLFMMNFGMFDGLLMLALVREYYLLMTYLWTNMEQFSETSKAAFDNIMEKFLGQGEVPSTGLSEYQVRVEAERENLIENIKSTIRAHQEYIKKIHIIKVYMEFRFTMAIIMIISTAFTAITGLYSDTFPVISKYKGVVLCIAIGILWYVYCYAGRLTADMGEIMIEKVNNIPWYHLDPPRRKTFYIFLNAIQKPVVFKAVGLYESGMPIFLQICKLCYTYFNFLQATNK